AAPPRRRSARSRASLRARARRPCRSRRGAPRWMARDRAQRPGGGAPRARSESGSRRGRGGRARYAPPRRLRRPDAPRGVPPRAALAARGSARASAPSRGTCPSPRARAQRRGSRSRRCRFPCLERVDEGFVEAAAAACLSVDGSPAHQERRQGSGQPRPPRVEGQLPDELTEPSGGEAHVRHLLACDLLLDPRTLLIPCLTEARGEAGRVLEIACLEAETHDGQEALDALARRHPLPEPVAHGKVAYGEAQGLDVPGVHRHVTQLVAEDAQEPAP